MRDGREEYIKQNKESIEFKKQSIFEKKPVQRNPIREEEGEDDKRRMHPSLKIQKSQVGQQLWTAVVNHLKFYIK